MLIRKKVSSPYQALNLRHWMDILRAHFRFVALLFKNSFKVKCILFYPDFPASGSAIEEVCQYLGYNMTNNPTIPHELSIYWIEPNEEKKPHEEVKVQAYAPSFNRYCHHFSQEQAKAVFEQLMDEAPPFTFARDEVEMRLFWVKNSIPLVHLISHPTGYSRPIVKIVRPEAALSEEEIKQISRFAQVIGLDFGELKVGRTDKKLILHFFSSQFSHAQDSALSLVTLNEHYILLSKAFKDAFLEGTVEQEEVV